MKVAVLGSGVIGVTSAWYLIEAGHDVVVIDRQSGPALETSFANAGEISPGYASPWAAPGIPQKAIRWLMMRHAPLILQPAIDREMLSWLFAMLRNCTNARYGINKARMVRLAEYSRDRLIALRTDTGISYDERMQGTLQLFRTQKQIDNTAKDIAVLRAGGVPFELLDREGCIAVEPGLSAARDKIAGGLRLPGDETGDCFKFTGALAAMAAQRGARFRYDETIRSLVVEGGRVTGVETDRGRVTADCYVLALGSHSAAVLRPLGLGLPVYPVKGYSITVPIVDSARAPESTLMDESYKIAITRLGGRIRVGGMAEISGYNNALPERRRATLVHSLTDLFAGAGDVAAASYWSGLRPMTPDGTPVIGSTPYGNLFLNTGHGTLGWTMACGSGRLIADLVSGRPTDIEAADLSIARYDA
ncbi:amino acid dehydrogenase [Sphingopyxis sp. Root214]|uniref:D-amino acid dehydrogenase n=1 Tax=unclassified Sphingopyxis TaxID=2614943 RepID=UPI0006FE1655|nr:MULTISPECIES: D-amino acid dehydrogenase [unclassified Sphingopyxis]KQZ76792.1 amino acid dehydrogenase [Sphingopyxis sp. Root154]KRC09321.1 amino acid dehydrogenase [Sphingopyxis sp. Root214]